MSNISILSFSKTALIVASQMKFLQIKPPCLTDCLPHNKSTLTQNSWETSQRRTWESIVGRRNTFTRRHFTSLQRHSQPQCSSLFVQRWLLPVIVAVASSLFSAEVPSSPRSEGSIFSTVIASNIGRCHLLYGSAIFYMVVPSSIRQCHLLCDCAIFTMTVASSITLVVTLLYFLHNCIQMVNISFQLRCDTRYRIDELRMCRSMSEDNYLWNILNQ